MGSYCVALKEIISNLRRWRFRKNKIQIPNRKFQIANSKLQIPKFQITKVEAGSWKLEAGNCMDKLETWNHELET